MDRMSRCRRGVVWCRDLRMEGGPVVDQETPEGLYSISRQAWEHLGVPQEELESVAGGRDVWVT